MIIETTYILRAEQGKILQNKIDGRQTPSVWLKVGDSKDNWEEIDEPVIVDDEEEDGTAEPTEL